MPTITVNVRFQVDGQPAPLWKVRILVTVARLLRIPLSMRTQHDWPTR